MGDLLDLQEEFRRETDRGFRGWVGDLKCCLDFGPGLLRRWSGPEGLVDDHRRAAGNIPLVTARVALVDEGWGAHVGLAVQESHEEIMELAAGECFLLDRQDTK